MIYKNVIESKYDRQNWLMLLRDIFGKRAEFWNAPSDVPTNSPFARHAQWLGTIVTDELLANLVEIGGGDTRTYMTAHLRESFPEEEAGITYELYLFFCLQQYHCIRIG